MLLDAIFGSENRERVLVFLAARQQGYPSEMAQFFDTNLYNIQIQCERLESGGVIISRQIGRTVVYQFNPRYVLLDELKTFLEKALAYYPEDLQKGLLLNPKRPRRQGKPIELKKIKTR